MQQATTVMQYPHPPLRRWTLQRYEKMPYPRIGPYSILSTRNESCTSVFDIPLDDIETCHGSVNHLANSLYQRGGVFYDHRELAPQLACPSVPILLVRVLSTRHDDIRIVAEIDEAMDQVLEK